MSQDRRAKLRRFSDIPIRPILWAWEDRLVAGGVSAIVGIGGRGKSLVTVWIAAMATTNQLPGTFQRSKTAVIIASAEDPSEQVIAPRLEAAGADRQHVFELRIDTDDPNDEQLLDLPTDAVRLCEAIEEAYAEGYDHVIVIIDPFRAHLYLEAQTEKEHHMRHVFTTINNVAESTGAAIVLVDHPNKRSEAKDLATRYSGAGTYNAVRSALVFGIDPENPDDDALRVLGRGKSNWAKGHPGLRFEIVERKVLNEEGEAQTVPVLDLHGECQPSGEDILEAESPKSHGAKVMTKSAAAEIFAQGYLWNSEPHDAQKVKAAIKAATDISERQLARVSKDWVWLVKEETEPGRWTWQLPAPETLPF